jgi:putative oxidoreductase
LNTIPADLAQLVIRLTLGAMLCVHGQNKIFGEGGLGGTTRWFESLGFRPAWLYARVAAATELGAGALLLIGLLTTLDCTAVIGLMTVAAATDHRGKGFFVFKGGWEYVVVVALVGFSLACAGPGRWSLDHVAGIGLTGAGWAALAAAVGVLTGMATVFAGTSRRWQGSAL